MSKLKYFFPILFIVFFLFGKTNIAQVTDSKTTLEQVLEDTLSNNKVNKELHKIDSNEEKNLSKTDTKKVEIASNLIDKDSQKVHSKNTEKKKATLKSRKRGSDLMNALRKAFKK